MNLPPELWEQVGMAAVNDLAREQNEWKKLVEMTAETVQKHIGPSFSIQIWPSGEVRIEEKDGNV